MPLYTLKVEKYDTVIYNIYTTIYLLLSSYYKKIDNEPFRVSYIRGINKHWSVAEVFYLYPILASSLEEEKQYRYKKNRTSSQLYHIFLEYWDNCSFRFCWSKETIP